MSRILQGPYLGSNLHDEDWRAWDFTLYLLKQSSDFIVIMNLVIDRAGEFN